MLFSVVAAITAVFGLVAAAPAEFVTPPPMVNIMHPHTNTLKRITQATRYLSERDDINLFSLAGDVISNLVDGLSLDDCNYMKSIGMAFMGLNAKSSALSRIWISDDGANTFTFTNNAGVPLTLVVWDQPEGAFVSSFMNVVRPQVSWSLRAGEALTVSVADGVVSGGWAALYDRATDLAWNKQINETWGEFTTGPYATADVTRIVNMAGTPMSIRVRANGCVSDMSSCSFHCKADGVNMCGEHGEVKLVDCEAGSQPGAHIGYRNGIDPEGGCGGWSNGGHLDVSLGSE